MPNLPKKLSIPQDLTLHVNFAVVGSSGTIHALTALAGDAISLLPRFDPNTRVVHIQTGQTITTKMKEESDDEDFSVS